MVSGKELIEHVSRNASSSADAKGTKGNLRFELEYDEAPDLATERERLRDYLGSDHFRLDPVHPELTRFLVLEFPGIERRISQQGQFAMASELVNTLGLRSATPEGGKNFPIQMDHVDPDMEDVEGRFGDAILDRTCWSEINEELDHAWVSRFLKLTDIWQANQGEGITIAQPDTGVASHQELDGTLDIDRAFNVFTGRQGDASDPLSEEAGNPGHGTATSSVICSGHKGKVLGIAPKASLVPIRCIDSVILGIDGSSVARAIMYAKSIDADIISMSLGGAFVYRSVQEALRIATANGTIAIAAAGNCVGVVVYPASDVNTIAVAGVGASDEPWKGTSSGRDVDISAPSENVFAARRDPNDGGQGTVRPSQGTSFGTALTAGVAALWLAYHGRKAVRDRARELGINVNTLFRQALQQTARLPAAGQWGSGMGAGVVDAQALLGLSLTEIGSSRQEAEIEAITQDQPMADHQEIVQLALRAETVAGFDWARHGAEAVFLSKESLARTSSGTSALIESSGRPIPSEKLAEEAKPDALRRVIERLANAPFADVSSPIITSKVDDVFEGLGPLHQGGLEDNIEARAARGEAIETRLEKLARGGGLEALRSANEGIIKKLNALDGDEGSVAARQEAAKDGLEALDQIRDGGDPRGLSLNSRVGLEALVRMTGRPAFRIRDGKVSRDDPMFVDGGWGETFASWSDLPGITRAVGRINLDSEHVGTGFLVKMGNKKNRIMTNRHVLEAIAEEVKTTSQTHWVFSEKGPNIDFSEPGTGGTSFEIKSVVFAGEKRIDGVVNLSALDLVILEIDPSAGDLPTPLTLSESKTPFGSEAEMFVVGYPARPGPSAFIDPSGKISGAEISDRLGKIFGIAYGRKYLSPGIVTTGIGGLPGDTKNWAFAHDATTLGGSSGSLVIALGGDGEVVGIHFAGRVLTHNLAHQIKMTGVLDILGS